MNRGVLERGAVKHPLGVSMMNVRCTSNGNLLSQAVPVVSRVDVEQMMHHLIRFGQGLIVMPRYPLECRFRHFACEGGG